MEKPYKVAVYCRVATEAQLAIDHQKEELTQYANVMGHHNLAYYIDNGMNGLTLDRPAFRQMEADIEAGGIAAILATDISRIGRDVWQTEHWIAALKEKGVTLHFATPPYEPPTPRITELAYQAYAKQRRRKRK